MRRRLLAVVLVLVLLGSSAVVFEIGPVFGLVVAVCLLVILGGIRFWRTRKTWTPKAVVAVGVFIFAGMAIAVLVPDGVPWKRIHRARCVNNLKQIGLALLSYHDAYKCFPPARICDESGKPMHSWRVLILPYMKRDDLNGYMECQDLYKKYNFKEPWDGPNNRLLEPQLAPYIYTCPFARWAGPNCPRTSYVLVTGPSTAFPEGKPLAPSEITRRPCDTVLVVETANSDIHPMEPRDMRLEDLAKPRPGACRPLTSHHVESDYWIDAEPASGNILCADASVHFLRGPISPEDATVLLTANDGKGLDIEKFAKQMPLVGRPRWDHIIGLPLFGLSLVALLVLAVMTPRAEEQPAPEGSSPTVEAPP